VKLDVSWLVYTVDVAETSSNGEVWRNWLKSLVNGKDILGLGVKGVVVNILVVDTILLSSSNTNFLSKIRIFFFFFFFTIGMTSYHLKPLLHGSGTFEVLGSSLNVKINLLLAQIDHVAGE
jgi:hypothetical protein